MPAWPRHVRRAAWLPWENFEPKEPLKNITIMKLLPIILTTLVFIAGNLYAEPEIKGTAAELTEHLTTIPRTVVVTGESEVKVPSDRALISLAVVTEHRSLQEASRANQELRSRMIKALDGQGIPAARIQASKFSSTPKYGVFGDKAKSYRVENVVKITAQDEKEFQAVANLVDAHSEVRYESIEFDHSDKEGLKKKALSQAIEKANEKQRLYEERLGVKLTVKGFEEGRDPSSGSVVGRRMYGSYSKGASVTALRSGTPGPGAVDEELPTSFAELVFKAHIVIDYTVTAK